MDDLMLTLILCITGVYLLLRLTRLSERTRMNREREELVREMVRKTVQQRRLDELYGRDHED
jgi:arginine/lysine/ornithine decarboxylase